MPMLLKLFVGSRLAHCRMGRNLYLKTILFARQERIRPLADD